MDDLRIRAQLGDVDRAGAVGTVFTRAEIAEAAAGTEFPATLLLELDRVESDGGATQARVAVEWDQETLEQLLASMEDPELELWFDESELAMAFDDVEGHGIREKAAVLAVAVVAAGASTTPAFARLASAPWGDGTVAPATVATIGSQAGAAERALMANESPSGTLGALSVGPQAGAAEHALMAAEGDSGTVGASSAGFSTPDPAGDKTAVMAGTERGLAQDRHISQNVSSDETAATTASGGGSTLSASELAGAVAGGALLIAAAGFGATRRRTPPAQPA
jgi:hypothetical protein